MRKLNMFILATTLSLTAFAGIVNGKITKIRTYDKGNKIRFESKVPNLSFQVKKVDILKAMTRNGKLTSSGDLERNGLIANEDRSVIIQLDRVKDGLHIKSRNHTMFVTEKELEKVR